MEIPGKSWTRNSIWFIINVTSFVFLRASKLPVEGG